jgi:hypothetical protein
MSTDCHPFADTVTVAVIDEVRATSAWLYESAEALQFIAPDRELLLAGCRCVEDGFGQLGNLTELTKNSPRNGKEQRVRSQNSDAL